MRIPDLNFVERFSRYAGFFEKPPVKIPSESVVDAPLIGNGDIGVAMGGDAGDLSFYIGKNDFWTQAHVGETWEQRSERLLSHDGDRERRTGSHIKTFGHIDIKIPGVNSSDYHVTQDILHGELRGDMGITGFENEGGYKITAFTPRNENLLIIEMEGIRRDIADVSIKPMAGEKGQYERYAYSEKVEDDLIWIKYSANPQNVPGKRAAVMAIRVLADDVILNDGNMGKGFTFSLEHEKKIYAVCSIISDLNHHDYMERAVELVRDITIDRIKEYRNENCRWWSDYWSKSKVLLGDEEIERYYYGSQYLLACCCKPGCPTPGLFGNWITKDRPRWTGSYTMNYNYNSPFLGLYTGNHADIIVDYCQPLLDIIPVGKLFAMNKLGLRGVYLPVETGPFGIICSTLFFGQKINAAHCAVNLFLHFYHTWDLDYAVRTYPYLKEVAEFWEDWLELRDGRYVIPHDHTGEYYDDYEGYTNCTLSLAVIKFFFKGMLCIAGELNIDAEKFTLWQDFIDRMSEYPIIEKDGKKIWAGSDPDLNPGKEEDPLYVSLYPFMETGLSSPKEELEIARNTYDDLNYWDTFNTFGTYYPAQARVGHDPEDILHHLRIQIRNRGMHNLFIHHGGGGIEDCAGIPAAIHEMMMQSYEGFIRIFPVWSRERDACFENLSAWGAFLVSSEMKDGVIKYVKILSEKGRECVILNPWKQAVITIGNDIIVTDEEFITIDTSIGQVIVLEQKLN